MPLEKRVNADAEADAVADADAGADANSGVATAASQRPIGNAKSRMLATKAVRSTTI